MSDIEKVKELVESAYIYIPFDHEALVISHCDHDDGMFFTTGEESGDEIAVKYEEVDLEKDMFYKLVLMDI
jgi:hypothetical protein